MSYFNKEIVKRNIACLALAASLFISPFARNYRNYRDYVTAKSTTELTYETYKTSKKEYRPNLEVTETKAYNIDGTWAHTRPDEKVVVMLPPEFRDYNLPIFVHEVLHNRHPKWSEGMVRQAAYNKVLADDAVQSFDYTRKAA